MFYNNRGLYPMSMGALSAAKPRINWGSLLTNTQKTLGIINQSIPIFYQVKPIWNNVRTMFKVMGQMKEPAVSQQQKTAVQNTPSQAQTNTTPSPNTSNNGGNPQFFL